MTWIVVVRMKDKLGSWLQEVALPDANEAEAFKAALPSGVSWIYSGPLIVRTASEALAFVERMTDACDRH